jgi:hypothetical protein
MKHGFDQNKWGIEGETYLRSLRCKESNKKMSRGEDLWRRFECLEEEKIKGVKNL